MAAAAKAQSATFDELVKSNASLAKSVKDLTEANKKLTAELAEARKQSKGRSGRGSGRACKHCKNKGKQPKHAEEKCWELPQNAPNRPKDWVSCL